jgi:tetratricopeptide (TPR) repeat protein
MEYPLNESYSRMLTNQYLLLLDEYLNTDINDTRELAVIDEYLGELSANSEKSPDIELDVALNLIDIGNRFSDARYTEDESFNLQSVPEVVKTIQFAITMLNRIIEIDPENYSAISGLAEAYILIGNESEAAIWYDRLER